MELKIEYVPIGSIKPYKGNAKKHTKKQIEQIKQSIIAMKDAADVDVPVPFGFDYVNVPMEVVGNIYDNFELLEEG